MNLGAGLIWARSVAGYIIRSEMKQVKQQLIADMTRISGTTIVLD